MTDTLVIRHETVEEAAQSFGESLESDCARHVVAFTDPDELELLLSDGRMEMIETIMTEEPESIAHLADIVERKVAKARRDVRMLSKRDIVEVKEKDRGKKPRVPYENIRVEADVVTHETT